MENLQFFYNIRHPDYKKKRHSLCLDLLKRFDLLSFQDKLFMHLSSGQKKKVAIICALLNNSDVFLFDEVTTSLDEKSRNTLLKYLELIRKDKIIIWATHENELDNIKTKTLCVALSKKKKSCEIVSTICNHSAFYSHGSGQQLRNAVGSK